MKLIDVIKSKNGLAYLDKNKHQINRNYLRLDLETDYNANTDYGESKFSFKEYVRKLPKKLGSNLYDVLSRMWSNGGNKKLLALLHANRDGGIIIDFDGDCIDVELDGDISFTPYNKMPVFLNGQFVEKGRQKMSMFKFFKKIAPESILEKDIKEFVDLVYAQVALDLTIEFVKGTDIAENYNKIDTSGWFKSSCMSRVPKRRFKLYVDNPETIELAVIKNNNEIVGRFLRWKTNELGWVEDTLYFKTYAVFSWVNARAVAENSWRKINSERFINNKEAFLKRLHVPITTNKSNYDGETTPYLDTFRGVHDSLERLIHNNAPL